MSSSMRLLLAAVLVVGVAAPWRVHAQDANQAQDEIKKLQQELLKVKESLQLESLKTKELQMQVQKLKAEAAKTQDVAKALAKMLQSAQETIVKLNGKISAMVDAHAAWSNDKAKLIAELYAEIEKVKANGNFKPNPPAVAVKGTVSKLGEGGLVFVDRGSDHGLKVGHTLEVFRTQPMPKHLGMIRIFEISNNQAVGWLVGPAKNAGIKVGDQVADKFAGGK